MSLLSLFKKNKSEKTAKRRTGDMGEDIAAEHLKTLGYEIIDRNVQLSHKEIDIVAQNDEYTLIVEVKTISRSKKEADLAGVRPSDNIDRAKMQNLIYAANRWNTKNYSGRQLRIDVIEVYLGDIPAMVVHTENAINPSTLYRKRR